MIEISKKTRNKLYQILVKEKNAFGDHHERDGIIRFLEKIWDLRELPSTDFRSRYNKDFYTDVWQHMVNNNDWEYDDLFIERLNLLDDSGKFTQFIETILHPDVRSSEDEIKYYFDLINPFLEQEGYRLAIEDYNEQGKPLYKIHPNNLIENLPYDIKINSIKFNVQIQSGTSVDYLSVSLPSNFPSFVLIGYQWDDFSYKTSFELIYYEDSVTHIDIGSLKIMGDDSERSTINSIPNSFKALESNFCSLGQTQNYYGNLKAVFPNTFKSILFALRDAAFFPQIEENFERNKKFSTSLIRADEAERLLREIKYLIGGYDLKLLYSFSYNFQPLFADTPIDVHFNFNGNTDFPSRIIGIIGKNGTGKTQLLTKLPVDFSKNRSEKFKPKLPIFSKLIAVSYSLFDDFEVPSKTAAFNYVYCGLKKDDDDKRTDKGLKIRFHNNRETIQKLDRVDKWRKILSNFLEEEVVDDFFTKKVDDFLSINEDEYETSLEGFHKITDRLSSGQSIILYIITEIVANIRLDSLILYDEPETHLHPNAITQLVNTIYELVEEFQSYCIMTTHSPLIIREIPSKDVFVMEREGNVPSVRRIGIESFGENLTTLSEEVFGNKSIPKQYQKIIQEFVDNGKSFKEIINLLEFDEMPLSLNARIYIKSLLKVRDEES